MLAHLVANHSPSLSSIASANCSSAALRACRSTSDSMPTEPLSKMRFSIQNYTQEHIVKLIVPPWSIP